MQLLTFRIGDQRFALAAETVREVVRAVAIAPLAGAPRVVEGGVNVRGRVVPVLDLRARFALPAQPLLPEEHLVLAMAGDRLVALRADEAEELAEVPDASVASPDALSPTLRHIAGLAALPEGAIVIADLAAFLSAWESEALDAALAGADAAPAAAR